MPHPSNPTQEAQRAEQLEGDEFVFTREASLVPGSYDESTNEVDVVFSTGARGLRYDWSTDQYYEEELEISDAAVDMSRVEAGVCQALDSHNRWSLASVMGIATRGWIDGGRAMARLRLSGREEIRGLVGDIKAGIIRAISVGYRVTSWQKITPEARTDGGSRILMRGIRWMPFEISFVPVPFDMGASTRSADMASRSADLPALDHFTAAAVQGRSLRQQLGASGEPAARSTDAAPQRPPQSAVITRALGAVASGATHSASAADAPLAARAAAHPIGENMPQQQTQGGANPQPNPAAEQSRAAPPAAQPGTVAPQAGGDDPAAAIAARAADITDLCARHGVANLAGEMIRRGITVEAAGLEILNARAVEDAAAGGHRNTRVETVTDEGQTRLRGLEEAMLHRVDVRAQLTDNGRRFRGMTLLEMGRAHLEACNVRTLGMDKMTLAGHILQHRSAGMMGTSDFSSLLANVANKRLRNSYEENPGTYSRWARRAPNLPDFKPTSVVQLSAMPDLLQTNEAGEITYGSVSDGATSYSLLTYARAVAFTRQAIVNDDLRGFDRIISGFGAAARRLENRTVYAQLTGNPKMSDNVDLFHASHGNLGTGAGSALQFSSLKSGRAAMRVQKGLQNEELNLAPTYLIVPAALEQDAYQLTSNNYVPATKSEVNEFRAGGRTAVEPIVEPILDGNSATAWYFAASNSQVDTVEYCWLDGAEGPVVDSQVGFDVDGIQIRCREDFAAKVIDYRGLYKAAGA
jgi:hypothetical protein